jgi:hypothetical protein
MLPHRRTPESADAKPEGDHEHESTYPTRGRASILRPNHRELMHPESRPVRLAEPRTSTSGRPLHSAACIRDDLALDPGRHLDHSLRLDNLG